LGGNIRWVSYAGSFLTSPAEYLSPPKIQTTSGWNLMAQEPN
jgi:hypothetical protein